MELSQHNIHRRFDELAIYRPRQSAQQLLHRAPASCSHTEKKKYCRTFCRWPMPCNCSQQQRYKNPTQKIENKTKLKTSHSFTRLFFDLSMSRIFLPRKRVNNTLPLSLIKLKYVIIISFVYINKA